MPSISPLEVDRIVALLEAGSKEVENLSKYYRRDRSDKAAWRTVPPRVTVEALFLGPYAMDAFLRSRGNYWNGLFETNFGIHCALQIADPPYNMDASIVRDTE